jgi:solute carrier family 45 protein 1/2/4
MFLAWTREFIGALLGAFGASREGEAVKTTSIIFAVIMIYVLDFSVNVIQAGIRAFIVDNAPLHQQDTANAWANRMSNVGNIILYIFGYIDLPRYLWFFGNTQFKVLCVIASVGLMITVLVSCFSIKEKSYRQSGSKPAKGGVLTFFKTLFRSIRYLPRQIKRVCQVQLAAWIGWFPFLFYGSTYIGEIYVDPIFRENPNMTPAEVDAVWEQGTRIGTFALLIFAVTSLVASIVIPWFIVDPYKQINKPSVTTPLTPTSAFPPASTEPLTDSHGDYFSSNPLPPSSKRSNNKPTTFLHRLTRASKKSSAFDLTIPGLTLRRAWMYSLLLFALLMLLTFAARSTTAATILVAFIGIPWSITMWAPFALIAAEVRKRDALRERSEQQELSSSSPDVNNGTADPAGAPSAAAGRQGSNVGAGEVTETGLILGIHNVAVSAPQVVATLISAGIFQALEKPRGQAGDGSVAWVLRFGGVLALVAAGLTLRVADEEPLLEGRDGRGEV